MVFAASDSDVTMARSMMRLGHIVFRSTPQFFVCVCGETRSRDGPNERNVSLDFSLEGYAPRRSGIVKYIKVGGGPLVQHYFELWLCNISLFS